MLLAKIKKHTHIRKQIDEIMLKNVTIRKFKGTKIVY